MSQPPTLPDPTLPDPDPPKPPEGARLVFNHWLEVMGKGPRHKLTSDRRRKIDARLKEGYTVDEIKRAVTGCTYSAWHMGDNPAKKEHNGIGVICRNGEKLEEFRDLEPTVSKPRDIKRDGPPVPKLGIHRNALP